MKLSDEPSVAEGVHGSSTTIGASTYDPLVQARVAVLGPVAVTDAAGRSVPVGGRARKVLVGLAMSSGAPLSIDALIDAVWPARPPTTARKAILNAISRLRQLLGNDALERFGTSYRLLAGTDLGEVNVVLAALRAGERVTPEGLRRTLDLWRGDPLCDLADWPVADAEGRRWALIREDLEDAWAEATLADGLTAGLTEALEAMVSRSPLREHRWALLMQALANEGRRADALRVFERARRLLGDEVGLPPGPELAAAERSILQAAATFVTDESPEFVGRATDLATLRGLWDWARSGHFVGARIEGDAGIGKSRLVRELVREIGASARTIVVAQPGQLVPTLAQAATTHPGVRGDYPAMLDRALGFSIGTVPSPDEVARAVGSFLGDL